MVLQAAEYEAAQGLALQPFFDSTRGRFQTPIGRAWAAEVDRRRAAGAMEGSFAPVGGRGTACMGAADAAVVALRAAAPVRAENRNIAPGGGVPEGGVPADEGECDRHQAAGGGTVSAVGGSAVPRGAAAGEQGGAASTGAKELPAEARADGAQQQLPQQAAAAAGGVRFAARVADQRGRAGDTQARASAPQM